MDNQMMEANSAAVTPEQPVAEWTCDRCEMTVTFTDVLVTPPEVVMPPSAKRVLPLHSLAMVTRA